MTKSKLLLWSATGLCLSMLSATAVNIPTFNLAVALNADVPCVYAATIFDQFPGGPQFILGDSLLAPPDTDMTLTGTSVPINNSATYLCGLFGPPVSWDTSVALPSGIGVWNYTGNASSGLGIDYTFVKVYNFSLLSSSNLVDWSAVCTVVGWTGADVESNEPWVCQVAYTNGIPASTNWIKFQIVDTDPASLLIYGDIRTNACAPGQTCQFYRLSCDTNAISYVGP